MGEIIRTMMDLIAYEVCGKEIDRLRYILTDEKFAKLYKPRNPMALPILSAMR